jgi:hypothetical protein
VGGLHKLEYLRIQTASPLPTLNQRSKNVAFTHRNPHTRSERWQQKLRDSVTCWSDEKVTFDNVSTPEASTLPGYDKIRMCCSSAKRYGFDYVWIDTCCIDKRSSTELSEAINSMYKWYAAAELCFVYLDDYTEEDPSVKSQQRAGISKSRWFTRGWTLQELLAPKELVFFQFRLRRIRDKIHSEGYYF